MNQRAAFAAGLLPAAALLSAMALAQEPKFKRSAELTLEGRAYLERAAHPGQMHGGFALSGEAEFDYALSDAASLRFVPFARWDHRDDERNHFDVRELALRWRHGSVDTVIGISRVFWGVTEAVHLVDIVNQTDLVEDPDGEDKLGQPMLQATWSTRLGNLSGFVLPVFRERTLPGVEGRLRSSVPYDRGEPLYESARKDNHLDWALRYALTAGAVDLGVAHFSGTAREPRFIERTGASGAVLTPVYDLIDQTSIDVSWVTGAWLWKLESAHRQSRLERYTTAAGGFEYTHSGAFGSAWDAGMLLEYLWDERGDAGASGFQNDVFIGTRWSGNDVAGTELLAGVAVDLDHQGLFANIEASRRVGAAGKLTLKVRLFDNESPVDPLQVFARDDYLQLEYTRFW